MPYKRSCFSDYVKMICAEQKAALQEFMEALPNKRGAHLTFVMNYKRKNLAEWEAYQAEWNETYLISHDNNEGDDSCGDPIERPTCD